MYATAAVTAAPDVADGHIACGHLALTSADPEHAASHFRIAIGLAPHLAEAHEQLGRMLLEAGYIEPAIARLEEAIAISPNLRSANWEIARSHALLSQWDQCDRIIAELTGGGLDRPVSRARYAWWRSDWKALAALRVSLRDLDRLLWPGVLDVIMEIFLDGVPWSSKQDILVGALRADTENRRRRVFIAQLSAETAAFPRDADAVISPPRFRALPRAGRGCTQRDPGRPVRRPRRPVSDPGCADPPLAIGRCFAVRASDADPTPRVSSEADC